MAIELQTLIPDTGWVDLPLREGTPGEASYRKIGDRVTVKYVGTPDDAGFFLEDPLPAHLRPGVALNRAVYISGSNSRRIFINTNGRIQLLPVPWSGSVSLEESWLTT